LLSLQPFEGVVVKACKDKGINKLIKARIGVSEPAFEQRIKILRKV
jgi:DNA-binding transcriptional regulator YdaS (Cro superfamily)